MIRGEIWWADYGIPFGSEPGFNRPVVIIQTDDLNRSNMNTVIVIPLTTNLLLEHAPGNVLIHKNFSKLTKDSVAVVSQISVIDKRRLLKRESKLPSLLVDALEAGIKLILDLA